MRGEITDGDVAAVNEVQAKIAALLDELQVSQDIGTCALVQLAIKAFLVNGKSARDMIELFAISVSLMTGSKIVIHKGDQNGD